MNDEIEQVRKFYEIIWNQHDKQAIPDVLHESFHFRGSLGLEMQGHSGFIEYLDMVHSALENYKCAIIETVAENSRVFAKMRFSGIHKGLFMGAKPTGHRVTWEGAALFHFKGDKIFRLWVLGDMLSLQAQLKENIASPGAR